jgi:hypothetical protein
MGHLILEVGLKGNNKEEENSYSRIEIIMKGNGNLEKCMEKEFLSKSMDKQNKVIGSMENFYRKATD